MINKFNSIIYVPYNSKIIVLNNLNNSLKTFFIIFNNKKFIFASKNKFIINKWGNFILFIKNNKSENQIKINNEFNSFFYSINCYFFKKIKFKGKGFRIKFLKKNKLIKFYFGRSHKTFIILKKIKKKKISKYKFLIYSINKNKTKNLSKTITNIKKINFYTLRGLRVSRQIILKRKGKKGTYI